MKSVCKLLFLFFLSTISLQAQDNLPAPMSPPRLVNDFAKLFATDEREDLEQMLRNYNDTTSTQIYVVTVTTLNGYDVSDYAVRLGEKWGIGQKDKNNGILILIKPRIGNERGQVYIATGYGVEATLNDARVGRIIDQYMLPHLPDNYYLGTRSTIEAIIKLLTGEFDANAKSDKLNAGEILFNIILILVILFTLYQFTKRGGGGSSSSHRRGGGFGGFGGGSWGGGSSRGGFGGGGGGSFGGGGAGRGF